MRLHLSFINYVMQHVNTDMLLQSEEKWDLSDLSVVQ